MRKAPPLTRHLFLTDVIMWGAAEEYICFSAINALFINYE